MVSSKQYLIRVFLIFYVFSDAICDADFVVVTEKQINFYSFGAATISVDVGLDTITAVTYDPNKKDVYVSLKNKKIYRLKTTGTKAYVLRITEPIVDEQNDIVRGLAFDHHTSTLYWKTYDGIYSVDVPDGEITVPLTGKVLMSFKELVVPIDGLVIDVERKQLYWWNSDSKSRYLKIERSQLDGSNRQTVWHELTIPPRCMILDSAKHTLYWIDWTWKPGRSIEKMVLRKHNKNDNGTQDDENEHYGTKDTLVHASEKHRPNVIAEDKQNVYWIDWYMNELYKIPKKSPLSYNFSKVLPTKISYMKLEHEPIGMFVPPNDEAKRFGKKNRKNENSVPVVYGTAEDHISL